MLKFLSEESPTVLSLCKKMSDFFLHFWKSFWSHNYLYVMFKVFVPSWLARYQNMGFTPTPTLNGNNFGFISLYMEHGDRNLSTVVLLDLSASETF